MLSLRLTDTNAIVFKQNGVEIARIWRHPSQREKRITIQASKDIEIRRVEREQGGNNVRHNGVV